MLFLLLLRFSVLLSLRFSPTPRSSSSFPLSPILFLQAAYTKRPATSTPRENAVGFPGSVEAGPGCDVEYVTAH